MSARTMTPDTVRYDEHGHEAGRTLRVKRACNGCGRVIGDITEAEIEAAVSGRPLPDVRDECGCADGAS